MAPLRANLAACSVVAGSMSATCANTPASVADGSTGCHRALCFVLFFPTMDAEWCTCRSALWYDVLYGRMCATWRQAICNFMQAPTAAVNTRSVRREELRVSLRTEHESDRCLERWCNPSLHRGLGMEISQKAKTAEHLHSRVWHGLWQISTFEIQTYFKSSCLEANVADVAGVLAAFFLSKCKFGKTCRVVSIS